MAAVRKVYQSLQSTAGTQGVVRLVSALCDYSETGVELMLEWSQTGVRNYLGSMPCIRISSCLHSTMSLVNMAWKYGMEAARTIR